MQFTKDSAKKLIEKIIIEMKKLFSLYMSLLKGKWYIKITTIIISLIVLFFLFVFSVTVNLFCLFGSSPSAELLDNPDQEETSEIYSADGVLIGKYFTENRSPITLEDVSDELINTLIHTEDERFYEHNGIDYSGLLGAIKDAMIGNARGGSTITQQLVKNLFNTRSEYTDGLLCKVPIIKTLIIKTKEWVGARRLEERYTKEEILTLYLNTVYFGSNAYGIKAAAKTYFNTTPKKLNYEQSACLIGLLKATTYYNPVRNPENNLKRRNIILNNLQEHNLLSKEMCDSICQQPLNLNYKVESNLNGKALYFRDAVSDELQEWCEENNVNLYQDGLKIYTSLDSRIQKHAENAVKKQMSEIQKRFNQHWKDEKPWRDRKQKELTSFIDETIKKTDVYRSLSKKYNGDKDSIEYYLHLPHKMKIFDYAKGTKEVTLSSIDSLEYILRFLHCGFVAMEPKTGLIKAWVGDIDYNYWQYDKVIAKRQPGSTFKLFVYAEAIRQGASPCDTRIDTAIHWMTEEQGKEVLWKPKNANGKFSEEEVRLKSAFARSINSIAVQLTREITLKKIVKLAHEMGIESDIRPIPSICLGTEDVSLLEMVSAYCAIVNEGNKVKPILVTHIKDKNGKIIYENKPLRKQVLDYETAFLMREMLREGLLDKQGTSLGLWRYNIHKKTDFGGKTGSTSNYSDAWYIGISPNLVAGAWVGGEYRCIHFRNGQQGQGSRTALPIFGSFMEKVMNDKNLASYRGRFEKPKQEIEKEYQCAAIDTTESGIRGLFRKIFGKDGEEITDTTIIKDDSTTEVKENKSRRELRQERRERRRRERERRR